MQGVRALARISNPSAPSSDVEPAQLRAFVESACNAKAVSGFKWKQSGIRYATNPYRITTSPRSRTAGAG